MSLTDFVKQEGVRGKLNREYPNEGYRAHEAVKASWQTQNYLLVGTAFDYLLRWWMRQNVDQFQARPWVAETSLKLAERVCPELQPDIESAIEEAKQHRDQYMESGTVSRPLIESAIDLARIDGIYRGGAPPTELGEYDDGDIIDCIRLLEVLEDSGELTGQQAYLNPAFGFGSSIVGGADADVILDETLVDVKVTGNDTFKADYWRQLVGYLTLADIHDTLVNTGVYEQMGISDDPNFRSLPRIEAFGVYFARHGELVTVSSDTVYETKGFGEFRSWFVDAALDYNSELDSELRSVVRTLF